ncbi:penicillin amidase [Naumannella cuiyingiana]|uniref:Penicillin amidase n=1 Tax=Naumannella cuiyingiana TaxID=1347891 RepID=A0A7Z0DAU4_9ACTN|nr:penicillin amidase [Naumannella cuiyingiana]
MSRSATRTGGSPRIERDRAGIATVIAATEDDAWFGMGYAAAQDRLWQFEYDRRRATGRWSEVIGAAGLPGDRLARRIDLADGARADVEAMAPATRRAFERHAAGVNAAAAEDLPPEYAERGLVFEPWEPWQAVAAFKIRHVLMGDWQFKLTRGMLIAGIGVEAAAALDPPLLPGLALTVPPGAVQGPLDDATAELIMASGREVAEAAELGFLAEAGAGSNVWAIGAERTASGKPLLVNDSHRAVDVPNAYWQVRVSCPEFDVAGATFPTLPGWPHFGANGHLAWAITHGSADNQDLFVEEFRDAGAESREADGWAPVQSRTERIAVRGGAEELITIARTARGPVVHGDPASGRALSLSWVATDRVCRQFDVLRTMIDCRSVAELLEVQAGWVDPVNNFVCADQRDIGYRLRGELPERAQPAGMSAPVPARAGGWTGRVPESDLPRMINPEPGWLANANNLVVDANSGPLITRYAPSPFRIERIGELLAARADWTAEEARAMQLDTVSTAARRWAAECARIGPLEGDAERTRALLAAWSGDLRDGRPAAAYARFRRALAASLLGEEAAGALRGAPADGVAVIMVRLVNRATLRPAEVDREVLVGALAAAWRTDPDDWTDLHRLRPTHTLGASAGFADPPEVPLPGDGDTIRAAGYALNADGFDVTLTTVYRQVIDFADPAASGWVIPGGISADPTDPHYADQLGPWARGELLPMPVPES